METEWMKKVRAPRRVPRKIIPYSEFKGWYEKKVAEARKSSIKRIIGK
jgi:hypothetical protein